MSDHAHVGGEKPSLLSNILAIIGLIILVVIIVWGLVHVAQLSGNWVSSLFPSTAPSVTVTAPKDATSGAPVAISWKYSTTVAGSYAFLYQCKTGVEFAAIDSVKNTASGIPCGAAYTLKSTNNTADILPLISGNTAVDVPFSIVFVPTVGTQVQGNATMTIHPGSATAVVTQTKPATTATPAKTTTTTAPARVATPADLSVRIISAQVDGYGNAVVIFDIANVGGSRSGSYTFSATLPTQTNTPYDSALQSPLAPGSHIQNTLRFSQAVIGTFSVTVNAGDAHQANNYAEQWMSGVTSYNTPVNAYGAPADTVVNSGYTSYDSYPHYQPYTY
jgi:hypothetical protein